MAILSPTPADGLLPIPRVQRQGIELIQQFRAAPSDRNADSYTLVLEVADLKHRLQEQTGITEALITVSFCPGPVDLLALHPDSGCYAGGIQTVSLGTEQYAFAMPGHGVTAETHPRQVLWRLTWNQNPSEDWAGFTLRNASPSGAIANLNPCHWAFRELLNLGIAFRVPAGSRVGATTRATLDWFGPDCGPTLRERGQVEGAFFYNPH